MSEKLDRARESVDGADREAVDDLAAVLGDMDLMTTFPGDDVGNVRTHGPILLAKLADLEHHGIGSHVPHHHHRSIGHLIRRFHALVARNLDLQREIDIMAEGSNVIVSTPIDNLAANTTSTQVTLGAPYSGVDFMLCDILLPAELTPAGRFASLVFCGIDFATPSINAATVQYANGTPGTLGTPNTQGMGLSAFYTNKTMPTGSRRFAPWTGWYFDASAKITFTLYNPSLTLPASYFPDWLMRSSPCPVEGTTVFSHARGHARFHEIDDVMDAIHGFTIGMGQRDPHNGGYAPRRAIRNAMTMLATPR